jgi:hypothetical protein
VRMVFIVSTLGVRLPQLARLLDSIQEQAAHGLVLISDQSSDGAVRQLAEKYCFTRVIATGRGLSIGRNACLETLDTLGLDESTLVLFPNDNTSYPPAVLSEISSRMASLGLDVLSGRLEYADGSAPFPVPSGRTVLGAQTATFALSATIAVRSSWFIKGMRFDESLGSGASSPYQAGEETDLLLRLIKAGARVELHSDLVIHGDDATATLPIAQQIRKTWGYSRAHTHVLRRHGLSRGNLARSLVRPLMRTILSMAVLDFRHAVIAMTRFLGRCRGLVPW